MAQLATWARALGDETRLKLLRLLMERELAVHQLVELLDTGQSRVSQHLAKLKSAGLIRDRRAGREICYSADPSAVLAFERDLWEFLHTPIRGESGTEVALQPPGPGDFEAAGGTENVVPLAFRPQPVPARAQRAPRTRPNVLFLCTGNSFRSQLAEAWARTLGGGHLVAQSAGLEPSRIHPLAETVMREVGISLVGHYSKGISPSLLASADIIITVCGSALGWFPLVQKHVRQEHWPFPDPTALAVSDEAALEQARNVRDGIRRRVEVLLASLQTAS